MKPFILTTYLAAAAGLLITSGTLSGQTLFNTYGPSNITATASSTSNPSDTAPSNTINGSGLSQTTGYGTHDSSTQKSWQSAAAGVTAYESNPAWDPDAFDEFIDWDLGSTPIVLESIHVWNYNDGSRYDSGINQLDIWVSSVASPGDPEDGGAADWTLIGENVRLSKAPGSAAYTGVDLEADTGISLPSTPVRWIRFEVDSNHWDGGGFGNSGSLFSENAAALAEIQFFEEVDPTITPADFVDNRSGGPVSVDNPVVYTLTFSEELEDSTVATTDFADDGTSAASIDAVTQVSPGIFEVTVTPTLTGTLQLKILSGTGLTDTAGNPLDTSADIVDDTSITVIDNDAPVVDAGVDQILSSFSSSPWSPAFIDTALWLDAADTDTITESSGSVSQWADKSGNGNHASQNTAVNQPATGGSIGGKNAIQFDPTDPADHLNTDLEQLTTVSIYLVIDPTARGTNAYIAALGASANGYGTNSGLFWPLEQYGDSSPRNQVFYTNSDLKSNVFANGVENANHSFNPVILSHQGTDLPTANLDYLIGNRAESLNNAFAYSGLIGEIIICPEDHDEATRQNMEGYLAHKWGISLPSGHPYETTAPTVDSATAILDATVTDPEEDPLSTTWSLVSGPAGVVFDNLAAIDTTATFIATGTYVLELTADDSFSQSSDQVTITVSDPVDTFSSWIGGFDVGGQTALTDDPDADGNENGIENYFGTDPSAFSQGIVSGTLTGNTFTFTHPLNATPASDLTASYRWSKDLASFHGDGVEFEGTTVSFSQGAPSGGMVSVTATITGTAIDKLFVDIQVTQP